MGIGSHEKQNRGKTDVWLTPLNIIKALGEFDLDPCGESFHPTAKTIYTENGLDQIWFGRVWLNPPYSEVKKWLDRLVAHGNGVALVFARFDTKWAQEIIPKTSSMFIPKGRIKFLQKDLTKKWNAGAPSVFLSFGEVPHWGNLGQGLSVQFKDKGES